MKNSKLDERLWKLEKQMDVPDFEFGSTRIAWQCLTSRERLVFDKLMKIEKEYSDEPPSDVIRENIDLYHATSRILWMRTMDLFNTLIDAVFLRHDPFARWIFWSRFAAFFNTTHEIVKMHRLEDTFYKKFEEEYGEDWMDVLQKKYGDNWPSPDYSSIGERDFNKELRNITKSSIHGND